MSISDGYGKLMVTEILGDAEAFVFDWSTFDDAQKKAFIARHLAAFEANLKGKGAPFSNYTPEIALSTFRARRRITRDLRWISGRSAATSDR
jgi:hypothetical protein